MAATPPPGDPAAAAAAAAAAALLQAQIIVRATQNYFVAMYAVVVWDWIISLKRERRLIWQAKPSTTVFLYYFCRYWVIACVPVVLWVFVTDHTEAACHKIFNIPVLLAMWNQVSAEAILLLRTYAFLGQNRILGVGLVTLLCGVIAYQMWVGIAGMVLLPFLFPPFDKGPCFPVAPPHSIHVTGFFIAPLIFDTLVTLLSVGRAISLSRASGTTSALMKTFVREGLFYFILISIANLINGIFYLQPKQAYSALNIPLSIMFPNILACRLILDLREAGTATNISHSSHSRSGTNNSGGIFGFGTRGRGNSVGAQQSLEANIKLGSFTANSNVHGLNGTPGSFTKSEHDLESTVYNVAELKSSSGHVSSTNSRSRSNTNGPEEIPMDTIYQSKVPSVVGSHPFSNMKQGGIRVDVEHMRYDADDGSSGGSFKRANGTQ